MKHLRTPFKLLVCAVLLLTLVVSGVASAQDGIKRVVTITGPGDPHSIDPQHAFDTKDWDLENILFPALTVFDEESKQIVPGIAESWELSEDGLTYTFHLVPNQGESPERALASGLGRAALIIPVNFERDAHRGTGPMVQLLIDASDSNSATALGNMSAALNGSFN